MMKNKKRQIACFTEFMFLEKYKPTEKILRLAPTAHHIKLNMFSFFFIYYILVD